MKKFVTLTTLLLLLALAGGVYAQQVPVFNQYIFNPYVYNPARAGSGENGQLFLGHKKQWANMPGAPSSSILTFELPLYAQNSGVGMTFYADQSHIFSKVGGSFTYAYHIRTGDADDQLLSFGVSGGFLNQRIDFSKAQIQTADDPTLLTKAQSSTAFEVAFGLRYTYKRLTLDFSAPQLANTSIRYLDDQGGSGLSEFKLVNHFLAGARYKIPLSIENQLYLEPVAMVRAVVNLPVQYDLNFLLNWHNKVSVGGGWRSGGAGGVFASGINASFAAHINDNITIGYIYEMGGRQSLRPFLGDTHEFSLGFKFNKSQNKVRELENKMRMIEDGEMDVFGTAKNPEQDSTDAAAAAAAGAADKDAELMKTLQMWDDLKMLEEFRKLQRMKQLEELVELQDMLELIKEINKNTAAGSDGGAGTNRGEETNSNSSFFGKEIITVTTTNGAKIEFIKLGEVFFDQDSHKLTASSQADLNKMRDEIRAANDVAVVYLSGNASTEGTNTHNMILATRRSKSVQDYLVKTGLDNVIIFPVPYGEEDPIVPKDTAESERAKNRRVDVLILKQ